MNLLYQLHSAASPARKAADRLICAKVRRKYQIVGGYVPDGLGDMNVDQDLLSGKAESGKA